MHIHVMEFPFKTKGVLCRMEMNNVDYRGKGCSVAFFHFSIPHIFKTRNQNSVYNSIVKKIYFK